jgi:hypothetical protein
MPACVDQLSFFAFVKRHLTTWATCATGFILKNLSNCSQICNDKEEKFNVMDNKEKAQMALTQRFEKFSNKSDILPLVLL